jgi:RNA polymerase sigma-70 factor (ECF subfamily)
MQQSTVVELVMLSRQSDAKAFRKLVEAHQYMVYSLAFRMLCNEDDAMDVVQETFIKVWKHLNAYKTEMKFTTWLYSIASNVCLDQLKSARRKPINPIDTQNIVENIISDENNEQKLINSELAIIINGFTAQLSPKQKLVFTLRDLEGLEIKEIIEITGLEPEKIKSNLYLARQFIRKNLESL